jgi:sulfite exporter TauE/SafE
MVMCGPLALMVHTRGGSAASLRYLGGRLVSYTLLGFVAGSVAHALTALPFAPWLEALLSWTLALTLLANAFRSMRNTSSPRLVTLGRGPQRSLTGRALAALAHDPLLLGMATALLPCGALFAAVMAAAALGDAWLGALALATFSLLSGLSLLGVGQLARLAERRPRARWLVAAGLVLGAVIMIWRPIPALRAAGHPPSCPMHSEVL